MGYFFLTLLVLMVFGTNSQNLEQFVCDKIGLVENPTDENCISYYVCSMTSQGDLIQTEYTCPEGSIFLSEKEKCVENGICFRASRQSREAITMEKSGNVHYQCQDEQIFPFKCMMSGRFADLQGSNCNKYYSCSLLRNGSYVKSDLECPQGTLFDPSSQNCHRHYKCPCIHNDKRNTFSKLKRSIDEQLAPQMITTPANTFCSPPEMEFVCNETGRFPDRRDMSCNTYYLCDLDEHGNLTRRNYCCPKCLTFDPFLAKCTNEFICPCSSTEATQTITIISTEATEVVSSKTSAGETNLYSTTVKDSITSSYSAKDTGLTGNTEMSTSSSTSTNGAINECDTTVANNRFICTTRGRFADSTDLTCSSYFLCSPLRNGTLIKTSYRCPLNSWFDRSLKICSTRYVCPCNGITATSQRSSSSSFFTTNGSTKRTEEETSIYSTTSRDTSTTSHDAEDTKLTENTYMSTSSSTEGNSKTNSMETTTAATETINECEINGSNNTFICTSRGRFVDIADLTCSSYFLCSPLRNGSLIKTSYRCPINSWFDRSLQICSTRYICPCNAITSTSERISTFTMSTINGSSDTAKENTSIYSTTSRNTITTSHSETDAEFTDSSTGRSNTSTFVDISTTAATEAVNECDITGSNETFKCTNRGRFVNNGDLTCSSYFLCSPLRNGTLIKTSYRCPLNSWFDRSLHICSTRYVCPCNGITATSQRSSTTTFFSTNGSTESAEEETSIYPTTSRDTSTTIHDAEDTKLTENTDVSTSSSTKGNSKTTSVETTTTATEAINECDINGSNKTFICTSRGRFVDIADLTCSSYFLCSPLRNGSLIKTSYRCPINSWFDRSLQICSTRYICPCNAITSTSERTSTFTMSTINGSSETAKENTSIYSTTSRNTITTSHSENDAEFTGSTTGGSSTSTSVDITTTAATEAVNECDITGSNETFKCTNRGRFVNNGDLTCSSYFLCSPLRNGTLIKTSYRCPLNSWFDRSLHICSTRYVCPCNGITATSQRSSTTTFLSTNGSTESTEEETSIYPTTSRDTSTTSHDAEDTKLTENTDMSTSSSSEGNSKTTSVETTTAVTEPINECDINGSNKTFICTSRGRFVDIADLTCSSYFLCSPLRNGSLIKTSYRCPINSWFDRSLQICSTRYICPCNAITSTTERTSTFTMSTINGSSETAKENTSIYSTTSRNTITTSHSENDAEFTDSTTGGSSTSTSVDISTTAATEAVNECDITGSNDIFKCTTRGRFVDNGDLTCSSYFLCSPLRNGTLIKTSYRCPLNSWFDRSLHICSTRYVCPCNGITATSQRSSTSTLFTTNGSTESTEEETSIYPTTSRDTSTTSHGAEDTKLTENTDMSTSSSTEGNSKTNSVETTTAATEAINECDINGSNIPFICTSRGRFVDIADSTCSSYFLCSPLRNGTLIKTSYRCPLNSWFDRSLHICSTRYVCPCNGITATSQRSSTTTFLSTNGSTESTEEETSIYPTTSRDTSTTSHDAEDTKLTENTDMSTSSSSEGNSKTTSVETTTAVTEPINECDINGSNKTFICTSRGRFVDIADLTCSSYFLCSPLRNGSLIKTSYRCPINSWFDRSLQICSTRYICPCNAITSTTERTSTFTMSTINGSSETAKENTSIYSTTSRNTITTSHSENDAEFTDSTTGGSSTSTSVDISTTAATEAVNECDITGSNDIFKCTTRGRFVDNGDLTCSSYFLCSPLRNGTLIKTSYRCPLNSWFDRSLHICSTRYVCPCNGITATSQRSSTSTLFTTNGSTESTEEETSIYPTTSRDTSTTSHGAEDTKLTENTDMSTSSSTEGNSKTNSVETTTAATEAINECDINGSNIPFICTSRGRFVDIADSTCSSYFLCSPLRNGSLIKTSYRCPINSWFDRSLQICSTRYICPCNTITSTSEKGSTFTMSTINGSSETAKENTSIYSTTSRSTITTSHSENDAEFTDSTTEGSSTSPSVDISTTAATEAVNECDVTGLNEIFKCTTRGRFVDNGDLTCSSYFLCSPLRNGTLIKTSYRCPLNSWFDRSLHICSTRYVCPCNGITATSQRSSTSTLFTTNGSTESTEEETSIYPTTSRDTSTTSHGAEDTKLTENTDMSTSSSTEGKSKTNSVETTTVSTEAINECDINGSNIPFICTSRGRFVDTADLTCSSYFLCSPLRNGSLIKTSYRCPINSWFDRSLQICSTRYICPCNAITSTSEKGSTFTMSTINGYSETAKENTSIYSTTSRSTITTSHSENDAEITDSIEMNTTSTTRGSSTSTSVDISTTAATEAINECENNGSNKPFICTSRGRFFDRADLTCSSYFLCSPLRNGSLIKTSYRCPLNSWFDRSLQICSTRYVCPCNVITSTSEMKSTLTISTINGSSATTDENTGIYSTTSRDTTASDHSANDAETTKSTEMNISSSTGINSTSTSVDTSTSVVTEDVNECDINGSNKPFICTSRGRFVDRADLTCSSYFLCSPLRNGSLIKTSYRCPLNSWFDRSLQICSTRYICPCNAITSTSERSSMLTMSTINSSSETAKENTGIYSTTSRDTTTTSQSENDAEFTESTEIDTSSTTGGSSTSTSVDISTTAATEAVNECDITGANETFKCTTRGRFVNNGDLTCSSYFLCSPLRNGTLIKTSYRCPLNSWFDRSLQICSTRYVCPCNVITSTSEKSSTLTISTIDGSSETADKNTGIYSTTSRDTTTTNHSAKDANFTDSTEMNTSSSSGGNGTSTSLDTSTTAATEVINECDITASNKPFICTSRGRFVDRADLNCSSYFLCSSLRNGTLIKTLYHCPPNSWFDPSLQRCSTLYACPCSDTTVTSKVSSISSTSPTDAFTKTSENITSIEWSTSSKIYSTTDKLISTENTGFINSSSTQTISDSQSDYTESTSTEYFNLCIVPSQLKPFKCVSSGRFADRSDLTCSSYYHCTILADGTVVQAQYRCIEGTKFDPNIQNCSFLYQCPCDSAMITETQISTSNSPPTPNACDLVQKEFVCTTEGRFENPKDLSCCTYYLCRASDNGTIIQTEYTCVEGLKFDPDLRMCTKDYKCPCSVTESPRDYTDPFVDCTIPTEEFVCTKSGRFPDRQDVSCCNYILCSRTTNGSFIQTAYSCPLGTTFNPEQQKCSYNYECPCIRTEGAFTDRITRTSNSRIFSTITDITGNDVAIRNIGTKISKSQTTLTLSDCIPKLTLREFGCDVVGKFLNPQDPTCSSYIDCIADGTNIVKTMANCEENKKFDHILQKCTSNAICKICTEE